MEAKLEKNKSKITPIFSKSSSSPRPETASPKSGEVVLSGVSKKFRSANNSQKKSYSTLKSSFLSLFSSKDKNNSEDYFTALDNVSLSLTSGKSIGVIGRNGSGKSTILKLISGIYHPDSGTVKTKGRISALIELGAGFHPDFTGRENLVLGGIMFGLSKKEIEAREDEIIKYAELEDFIDNPVRTYSSGMYMRLGFSLAIHTEPDILLVDEVLSVGDASFTQRCQKSIAELKRRGTTMLIVSHDLDSISRWCDEVLWLSKGKLVKKGPAREVIDAYLSEVDESQDKRLDEINNNLKVVEDSDSKEEETKLEDTELEDTEPDEKKRWGNQKVLIENVRMFRVSSKENSTEDSLEKTLKETWVFNEEDDVLIEFDYQIKESIETLEFGIALLKADGQVVHGNNTSIEKIKVPLPSFSGASTSYKGKISYNLTRLSLLQGSYALDVAAHSKEGVPYDYQHMMQQFSVRSSKKLHGIYSPKRSWKVEALYQSKRGES